MNRLPLTASSLYAKIYLALYVIYIVKKKRF